MAFFTLKYVINLILAIQEDLETVTLLETLSQKRTIIETGTSEPSCITWSPNVDDLAIGTKKGNLVMFNHQSNEKNTCLGKHRDEITCGRWTKGNLIILGSVDGSVTVSNKDGDTMWQILLEDAPIDLVPIEPTSMKSLALIIRLNAKILFCETLCDSKETGEIHLKEEYGQPIFHSLLPDSDVVIVVCD